MLYDTNSNTDLIDRAILACHAAAMSDTDWKHAVEAVASVFNCVQGGLFIIGPQSHDHLIFETLNHTEESVLSYLDGDVEDLWIAAANTNGLFASPRAMRGSEFVDFESLIHSPFYKKCLQPNDIVDTLAIPVSVDSGIHGTFLVHANSRHGFFDQNDVAMAERLRPFIVSSINTYAAIERERTKVRLASLGLNSSNLAFYIFDRDLNLLFATDDSLRLGSTVISATEKLVSSVPGVMAWINDTVSRPPSHPDESAIERLVVTDPESGDDTVLQISPYEKSSNSLLHQSVDVSCYALLLRSAKSIKQLDLHPVAALFGFTQTETEIVADLMSGKSIAEISDRRSTSSATVRWHVKNALAKSDCQRQIDMIIKIQSLSFARRNL